MTTGWWPDPADYPLPWPVTDDPADVHPPCVLIHPLRATQTGLCAWDLEVEVVAIAPGPSQPGSRELWRTVAPAVAGIPGIGQVDAGTWQDMPCVRAVQTLEVTEL